MRSSCVPSSCGHAQSLRERATATVCWPVAAAVVGACWAPTRLAPAPEAAASSAAYAATSTTAGVTVDARARAWDGSPSDLRASVTPLLVSITNRGTAPLRVRYRELGLFADGGRRYLAIPPYALGVDDAPIAPAAYSAVSFAVAPYLSYLYPTLPAASGEWTADPLYYVDVHTQGMTAHHLPTPDMLRRALPEGVLAPGGTITGFVYFQRVEDGTARVEMRQFLIDAGTGVQFGVVTIPFRASGGVGPRTR